MTKLAFFIFLFLFQSACFSAETNRPSIEKDIKVETVIASNDPPVEMQSEMSPVNDSSILQKEELKKRDVNESSDLIPDNATQVSDPQGQLEVENSEEKIALDDSRDNESGQEEISPLKEVIPQTTTPETDELDPHTQMDDMSGEEIDDKNNEINLPLEETHNAWNALLGKYVSAKGVVNYKGLKSDLTQVNGYLDQLRNSKPSSGDRSNEAKAYWLNAYNAFTVKLILDNYPVSSIRDLENGNPWDKKWIKLGSEVYSLNQIEHEIIRPYWKDARIHFAVNCAAKSCPPLANRAFEAETTEDMLETLTSEFINSVEYNALSKGRVELSKIFEWYGEDFGEVINFLSKYAKVSIHPKARVSYKEYNWALNGK